MRISCVIFDMDGTVLNTLNDLYTAACKALVAHKLPAPSKEAVRQALGSGAKNLIHALVSHTADLSARPQLEDDVLSTFLACYATCHLDTTKPYPHIPELLRTLKEHSISRALLSNKPDADVSELVTRFFPDTFSYASGARSDYPLKPAPDHLYAILSQLSCPQEEALYVGDSEVDIQTAQAAGVHSAIVTWGFRDKAMLQASGARHLFDSVEELERYIIDHA